ncbi:MAG: glycosyltransferase family 2 protein [Actinomycetota bacterium]|nr:glycosyltransferase family 2 protein [Actinomycetota bacterium]
MSVQDKAGPVPATPRLPRGDHDDAHTAEPSRALCVVVATRDRAHLLAGLLDALGQVLRPTDEVLVVDSASRTDATARLCATRGVRVLRVTEPGTSRARNAGWHATSAELVAFTDDDCRPQPGWAAALSDALSDRDFVTGRVLPDRPVAVPISLLDDEHGRDLSERDVVGHGANCAFRRELLERLGGFDERLGPGTALRAGEDGDLLLRALRLGARGRYEPTAVVVHRQWRSRAQALRLSFGYGLGQAGGAVHRDAGVRTAVWDDGFAAAARDIRTGYPTGAVAGLLRGAGALVGAATARRRR